MFVTKIIILCISAIVDKLAVTEGAGLAKWKQITCPQSMHNSDKTISTDRGSLESLAEPNNNNSTNNNNGDSKCIQLFLLK